MNSNIIKIKDRNIKPTCKHRHDNSKKWSKGQTEHAQCGTCMQAHHTLLPTDTTFETNLRSLRKTSCDQTTLEGGLARPSTTTGSSSSFVLTLTLFISRDTVSHNSRPCLEVSNPFSTLVYILVWIHGIISSGSWKNNGSQCKGNVHITGEWNASKPTTMWSSPCNF